jgi:hypothetical protein
MQHLQQNTKPTFVQETQSGREFQGQMSPGQVKGHWAKVKGQIATVPRHTFSKI